MQKNAPNTTYRMDLRTKILHCALCNFREKGIKAVKMDDIANQLSVSKRTLYEIFNKKEDLLFACVKSHDEEMRQRLETLIQKNDTVMDILAAFLRLHIVESCHTNPLFYAELPKYPKVMEYIDRKHDTQREQSIGFMLKGVEEGFFREDVNYTVITHMTEVFMQNVMDTQYYHTFPMPESVKNVILLVLRGVCTEKGLQRLDLIDFDSMGE